jgi:DNA-binding transcriptional regulator YdaS (Cro superfamily)
MSNPNTPEERRRLAAQYGLSEPYLYQCLSGHASMKPIEAARIERETAGELTRRHLRPKDWHLIWPELVSEEFPAPDADKAATEARGVMV